MQAGFKDRMRSCSAGLHYLLHLYIWDARENEEGVGRYWIMDLKLRKRSWLAVHTQVGLCVWTSR